jgi:hypothetical protein
MGILEGIQSFLDVSSDIADLLLSFPCLLRLYRSATTPISPRCLAVGMEGSESPAPWKLYGGFWYRSLGCRRHKTQFLTDFDSIMERNSVYRRAR